MSIDEAIKQFKEDAEYYRADFDLEWAEENEQVAEWLEELKELRKFKNDFTDLGKLYSEIRLEERNKAIDDFAEQLSIRYTILEERGYVGVTFEKLIQNVFEYAEQLKGGIKNE